MAGKKVNPYERQVELQRASLRFRMPTIPPRLVAGKRE